MTELTFRAVGDNLLHSHVYNTCKQRDGSYNFDSLYEHVKSMISEADIAAVNQETVFVRDPKRYGSFPFFGTPEFVGGSLVRAGFNVVSHATNHVMDKGRGALEYTIDYWKNNYPEVSVLGIRKKSSNRRFELLERKGITFAMFNYTRTLNYHPRPIGRGYMIDLLKPRYKNKIARELKQARKQADIVAVFVHWGIEYEYSPCKAQRKWVRLFRDCGVDIVIGTHPHVVQPLVTIKRRDGKEMAVYYSLGNFISGQNRMPRLLGGLADVTIIKEDGSARVVRSELMPLITHVEPDGKAYTVYPLADYTDDLAAKHHIADICGFSASKETLHGLFNDMLEGNIEGEPNSKLDNVKSVLKHLVFKNKKTGR